MGKVWYAFKAEAPIFELFVNGYKLWKFIAEKKQIRNSDIAEAFDCPRSKPSRYLVDAYKYGLINAVYNPEDLRDKYFSLTPKGEEALRTIDEVLAWFENKVILEAPLISQVTHERRTTE